MNKVKYNLTKNNLPKSYNKTCGNIIEFMGNLIFLILFFVLGGLLYGGESGRGYPMPWLVSGQVIVQNLLISIALFGGLVIAAVVLAGYGRIGETDFTSQYRSANVSANRTYGVVINDMNDLRPQVAEKTRRSAADEYIPRIREMSELKGKRPSGLKPAPQKKTSTIEKSKTSGVISIVMFLIFLCISIIGMNISDGGYDIDSEYDGYETTYGIEAIRSVCERNLDYDLRYETDDFFDGLRAPEDSTIRFLDEDELKYSLDWESINGFVQVSEYVSDQEAVLCYRVDIADKFYLIAFKYCADDIYLATEDDLVLAGMAASGDIIYETYGTDCSYDPLSYDEDEWKEIYNEILQGMVAAGDYSTDDGAPILLRGDIVGTDEQDYFDVDDWDTEESDEIREG